MENKGKNEKIKKVQPKRLFSSRSLKYGSNSVIMIVAVLAIAVLVNMLFSPTVLNKLIGRDALKLDLTPNKLYSISKDTNEIMSKIDKQVQIYVLKDEEKVKSDGNLKMINELLAQYRKFGDKIKISYIDTDKDPSFIRGIDPDGLKEIKQSDLVFKSGTKIKKIDSYDFYASEMDQNTMQSQVTGFQGEQAITGAIKYVTAEKTPTVYFLEGHDEVKASTEMTELQKYFVYNNFEVKNLNLLTEGKVPADAEVLMIVGPKKDISSVEKDKLKEYFANGGKGVVAMDPLDNNPKFTNIEDVMSTFNLALGYDKIKENDSTKSVKNKPYDLVPTIESTSINQMFSSGDVMMILSKSRSIEALKNTKEYITVTPLLKSSNSSIGEPMDTSAGKESKGPLNIAVASENKGGAKVSKLIAIGNASFLTDKGTATYDTISKNSLLYFVYTVFWLQDQKNDVVIAPKPLSSPGLELTAASANVLALLTVIVLPLIILGFGTFVWMRRRHL